MGLQELQRQKQEYEKKKRRAEQLKAEGSSRRSGKPPMPHGAPTTNTQSNKSGARPPQPPVRSASVHADR